MRTTQKTLGDGTKLNITVHGDSSVVIDGKTFRIGDKLDDARKIVAITPEKVKVEDLTAAHVRGLNNSKWYKRNSQVLVNIKRRGEK